MNKWWHWAIAVSVMLSLVGTSWLIGFEAARHTQHGGAPSAKRYPSSYLFPTFLPAR